MNPNLLSYVESSSLSSKIQIILLEFNSAFSWACIRNKWELFETRMNLKVNKLDGAEGIVILDWFGMTGNDKADPNGRISWAIIPLEWGQSSRTKPRQNIMSQTLGIILYGSIKRNRERLLLNNPRKTLVNLTPPPPFSNSEKIHTTPLNSYAMASPPISQEKSP